MPRALARWLIEYDPDATRRCFVLFRPGTGCTCNQCRNFEACGASAFPAEFHDLAEALGVDTTKPVELLHYCRETTGLYSVGGWFHFVGSILSGDDAINADRSCHLEDLTPSFQIGLSADLSLVPEEFEELPLVELLFESKVPWVLDEPAPCD